MSLAKRQAQGMLLPASFRLPACESSGKFRLD